MSAAGSSANGAARPPEAAELTELTATQLMVWTRQKLQPDVPLYNLVALVTVPSALERRHFDAAFAALVRHTDALRTVIREVDGLPRQQVLADAPWCTEHVDLSREADPAGSLRAWAAARAQRRFDLGRCLVDSALVHLAEDRFVWYLGLHHLIADGWSFSVLLLRMRNLYVRALAGRLGEPLSFPRFQDFARDERAYRRSPRHAEDAAYWQRKLAAGADPAVFHGSEGRRRGSRVRRITRDLGAERTRRIEAMTAAPSSAGWARDASRLAVFAALLAAYLSRAAGGRSHLIGTPFQNRPSRAFKDTVGLCTQVVPLRLEVPGGSTFAGLVESARKEIAETLPRRQYPIPSSDHRAFDVEVNLHTRLGDRDVGGAVAHAEWVHPGHGATALSLHVESPDVSLRDYVLHVDLHEDVFDPDERPLVVERFLRMLDALLADPHQPVARVALDAPEARERLLVGFNRTAALYPEDQTLSGLFDSRVAQHAFRTAVVADGRSLAYAELDARATRLAHYLKVLGVGPEDRVGVCMERSLEMVVALLAVLKAGAAYLPLDPEQPSERLAFMLEDSGVRVALAQPRLAAMVTGAGRAVVCLDETAGEWADRTGAAVGHGPGPDSLAYVIYTSGSTGRPKGVMIPHRGIVNRLHWMQEAYGLTGADRVLQKTPFGFDVSVWELFWPLLAGACLVMARPGGHRDSGYLVRLIAEAGITTAHFVPSMLRAFVEEPGVEGCRSLSRVICSGEELPAELAARFFARLPETELHNLYGPTETSVDVTAWACERGSASRVVPIGRPIANTRIHVLDAALEPAPVGVPGELYVGGVGLARGYVGRPELTAEAFVPDPLGTEAGARLYRTGDLGRYRMDGAIEFLGRRDHQVKLRGVRIELGEIEAALRRHPTVRAAVVLAGDGDRANGQLVGYVVPAGPTPPTPSDLRLFLRRSLPEYMVPGALVVLERLPLTPNGKLDRRALPAPGPERPELAQGFVAPRTRTEEALAGIWAEVLGLDRVGVRDSFFDLGGASIQCLQVVARASSEGHPLTPDMMFEHETIEALARALESA